LTPTWWRVLRENERDEADHAYLIYALLTLELWLQTCVDRRGEEVTPEEGPARVAHTARSRPCCPARTERSHAAAPDDPASRDDGASWERVAALPRDRAARREPSRLACRLLRHEARALAELPDGRPIAANRRGVFSGQPGDAAPASRIEDDGLAVLPPLCIGAGPDAAVFGEYGSPRGRPMRLFASRDGGRSFRTVHSFVPGDVLHVHNVVFDAGQDHYWVLTGDFDAQPGIGRLSRDLARFEWFVRGEQRFRAVDLFDQGDRLRGSDRHPARRERADLA
jgi:hypothetical protein